MQSDVQTIIALDAGTVRTGVAMGNSLARLAGPLTTLNTADFARDFTELVRANKPSLIVVGLPRSLAAEHTDQTRWVEDFVKTNLSGYTVVFQDEALTSEKAETELKARSKPYVKADIDALAATYILQDYFDSVKVDSYEAS